MAEACNELCGWGTVQSHCARLERSCARYVAESTQNYRRYTAGSRTRSSISGGAQNIIICPHPVYSFLHLIYRCRYGVTNTVQVAGGDSLEKMRLDFWSGGFS